MSVVNVLVIGIITGFAIAIPVGSVWAHCMRRSLIMGRRSGYVSGLGAACADIVFAVVAVFGVAALSNFFTDYRNHLMLLGSVVLLSIGLKAMFKELPADAFTKTRLFSLADAVGDFFSTFLLSMTNPMTAVSIAIAISVFKIPEIGKQSLFLGTVLVAGVFVGSLLWWIALSEIVHHLKSKMEERTWRMINKGTGVIMFLLGVLLALDVFWLHIL